MVYWEVPMRTYRQLALNTMDLEQVTVQITCHLHGPSGDLTLGYEITSGPGGEPLQLEALGCHWAVTRLPEALDEIHEMLRAARDYLVPF